MFCFVLHLFLTKLKKTILLRMRTSCSPVIVFFWVFYVSYFSVLLDGSDGDEIEGLTEDSRHEVGV